MSGPPRQRACPTCGALDVARLFEQRFQHLSGVEGLDGYDVVVCRRCGLAFANGIPAQAVLDRYYRDLSKYDYAHTGGRGSALDERRFRDIAETIAAAVPRQSRVLEIGCATGRLLSLLREHGFSDVHGLDPSRACATRASEMYGIEVSVGSLADLPALGDTFDFMILIGVLEHIEDVPGALDVLRGALGEKGGLYVEVPDVANLAGHPDGAFQEFSIEHVNFFSMFSLVNLLGVYGFAAETTGEVVRQQHDNTAYPAAFGVFRKTDSRRPFERDVLTEPQLQRYIDESSRVERETRQTIERLAAGKRVVVWGTGTHTRRLLAIGAFTNVEIAAFVDSNPKYHGRTLGGVPVWSPAFLTGRDEPILISTRGFQSEIEDQIRRDLALDNEILLLFQ